MIPPLLDIMYPTNYNDENQSRGAIAESAAESRRPFEPDPGNTGDRDAEYCLCRMFFHAVDRSGKMIASLQKKEACLCL